MADLAHISRSWLLSPRQPRTLIPRAPIASLLIRTVVTSKYSKPKRHGERHLREANEFRNQNLMKEMSMLLPNTIVPPPISRWPRSPKKLAHFLWLLVHNRFYVERTKFGLWISSAMNNSSLQRPKLKLGKKSAIPAGTALYQQMYEAAAAGDKDALRRFCSAEWVQHLGNGIDKRPRHIRTEWEMVRSVNAMRYPRLADFRLSYQPLGNFGVKLVKQATVSIATVQRLTRYDMSKGGPIVPGTGIEQERLEHIVIQSEIDENTWESTPWKVWGVLPEQTYEQIRDDKQLMDSVMTAQR